MMQIELNKISDLLTKSLSVREDVDAAHRLVRHLIAGGVGTVGYVAIVVFLVEVINIRPVHGVVIAFLVLEIYTYIVNRSWVYNATNAHIVAVPRFVAVIIITFLLNTGIMYLANDIFKWWYGIGLLLTVLILPATNFSLNYFWTFRDPQQKL